MKKVQVIWSDEAFIDLETIYDFLKEKSQPTAQGVIESILSRSRQLESFPKSGTKQETMRASKGEYRYLVEGNYKIVYKYQLENQSVYIAMIFDTRKDPEKLKV